MPQMISSNRAATVLKRFGASTGGIAAVEFGLLLPIMMTLFVGSIEFSQAITADRRITQVASSTADLIAREKVMTTAKVSAVMDVIQFLMRPYDPSPMRMTVLNVYANPANVNDTKVCWSYNHNGGTTTYTNGQAYALPPGLVEAGDSVVIADVSYLYTPFFFSTWQWFQAAFPLRETFYVKPRLSSYVQYNGVNCA